MVELGLAEERSGIECIGAQSYRSGSKRWEEQQPETAKTLMEIAEAHGQQDPSFKTTIAYTRLTASQAIKELKQRGYEETQYHSKYNPIERCWGILEQHWNGAKLIDVETMLAWAKSMTWKGINPIVNLSQSIYAKGISLSKQQMKIVEQSLMRNPELPKWDILICP